LIEGQILMKPLRSIAPSPEQTNGPDRPKRPAKAPFSAVLRSALKEIFDSSLAARNEFDIVRELFYPVSP
jgi:hypothetical protein